MSEDALIFCEVEWDLLTELQFKNPLENSRAALGCVPEKLWVPQGRHFKGSGYVSCERSEADLAWHVAKPSRGEDFHITKEHPTARKP